MNTHIHKTHGRQCSSILTIVSGTTLKNKKGSMKSMKKKLNARPANSTVERRRRCMSEKRITEKKIQHAVEHISIAFPFLFFFLDSVRVLFAFFNSATSCYAIALIQHSTKMSWHTQLSNCALNRLLAPSSLLEKRWRWTLRCSVHSQL